MPQNQRVIYHPLGMGERIKRIVLQDERIKPFDLTELIGRPVIIFYFLDIKRKECRHELTLIQDNIDAFRNLGVSVIGMSVNTAVDLYDGARELKLLFPLLSDPELIGATDLGLAHVTKVGPKEAVEVHRSTLILDATLRVRQLYFPNDVKDHIQFLIAELPKILPENVPYITKPHAPVLQIPHIFEPALCKEIKLRKEISPSLLAMIDHRLKERVVPELVKAMFFRPSGREIPRIIKQSSEIDLPSKPVRMHTLIGKERSRYVIVIALNDHDYEGGGFSFPEYGRACYSPSMGDGIVYSTLLLQEELMVSKGEAWFLQSFFYTDRDDALTEALQKLQTGFYGTKEKDGPVDPVF